MALYRVRLIGLYLSGIPDDLMSMSWGVDAPSPPSGAALHAAWLTSWATPSLSTGWRAYLPSGWGTHSWEVTAAAGGPVLDYQPVDRIAGNGAAPTGPQITFPISMLVPTSRVPARRGRLNFGPVAHGVGAGRPGIGQIANILNGCVTWHNALLGLGMEPVYLTGGGTSAQEVIGYSAGNAYGTMRSRKSEATSRTNVML